MKVRVSFEVPTAEIKAVIRRAAEAANERIDVPGVPESLEEAVVERLLETVDGVIDRELPQILSRAVATVTSDRVKIEVE